MRTVFYSIKILGFIVLASVFFKSFVAEIYIVPSDSMYPTLHNGDFIVVWKSAYTITSPEYFPFTKICIPSFKMRSISNIQRGDVVVFKTPKYIKGKKIRDTNPYVKRCVALPGDFVEYKNEIVTVKIKNLFLRDSCYESERNFGLFVPSKGDTISINFTTSQMYYDVIRYEGHKVEQKDNTDILIDGKNASFYIVMNNYYFMVGDNKETSIDSRKWGFLPEEYIIGKVVFIFSLMNRCICLV